MLLVGEKAGISGMRFARRAAGSALLAGLFALSAPDLSFAQQSSEEGAHLAGTLTQAPAFVVERYRTRAAAGDAKAQFYLGYLYERRMIAGDESSLEMAAHYYGKAAKAGHAAAQYKRAAMAQSGIGGPKDIPLATRLYKAAAEQGLREAQFNYALLLEEERQFAATPDDARYWYERAAYQGVVPAMLALGRLYGGGGDGHPDLVEAWAWLALAEQTERDPTGRTAKALALIWDRLDEPMRGEAQELLVAYGQLQPRRSADPGATEGPSSDSDNSDVSSQ